MTPDQMARRIAEHMLATEGTGPHWKLEILDVAVGFARLAMEVRADMLNGHGTAHGGMIFALADTAFAYACNSRNVATVAQSANITFLAPARLGDRLIAEARELSGAGRVGVYGVSVRRGDGQIIAEFQGLSRSIGGAIVATEDFSTEKE
jgi:acyl-CoA thioesterase